MYLKVATQMISPPKFKLKDRVLLRRNTFVPTNKFPVKGSNYECEGSVVSILNTHGGTCIVRVAWDNGRSTRFSEDFLEIIEGNTDCKSIW